MNIAATVLGIGLLATGSSSVYLYTQLDAERTRADAEAALRRDQEERVKALEDARYKLQQQLHAMNGLPPPPPPLISDPAKPSEPVRVATHTGPGKEPNEDMRRQMEERRAAWRRQFNDPAALKAMQNQHKMGLRMMYKDLAKELNLTTEEANKLMDLLASQQVEQMRAIQDLGEDRNPATVQQAMEKLQQQNETALMSALGHKYSQYQEYQRTLPDRMQAQQLSMQLQAANLPLNDSQEKQLTTILSDERRAYPQPSWSESATPQENMTRQQQWQQEYNKRVRNRVSNVFNSEQLKQYEEMQQAQSMGPGAAMMMMGPGAVSMRAIAAPARN